MTNPTQAAKDWIAANPEHEAAVHVREALASSDRHEAIAEAVANAPPGGTYVLVIHDDGRRTPILTAVGRINEQEIAAVWVRWATARRIERLRETAELAMARAEAYEEYAAAKFQQADDLERDNG